MSQPPIDELDVAADLTEERGLRGVAAFLRATAKRHRAASFSSRAAYLILFFKVEATKTTPTFLEAGVFSEDANSLTRVNWSNDTILVNGPVGYGTDYEEACADLREELSRDPAYRGWIFQHLRSEPLDGELVIGDE